MPPLPFEYEGREPASRFFASIFGSGRRFRLLRTRANGQPALGAYVRDATGVSHGVGLFVITLAGDEICGRGAGGPTCLTRPLARELG